MKTERTITVCNNCGFESLVDSEFAHVSIVLDGHVRYDLDLCRPDCLPRLVDVARQGEQLEVGAPVAEPVADSLSGKVCSACGRTFASPNGLKVHISRMHS